MIKRAMNILSVSPLPKTPLYAPTVTPIPYSPYQRNISAFHHYNSQVPLVSLAREMVAYLHTAFLPAPDSRGAINVASEGPAYTYTKVAWTKGNNLYQVFNNVNAIDALKMAVSMRLYTK